MDGCPDVVENEAADVAGPRHFRRHRDPSWALCARLDQRHRQSLRTPRQRAALTPPPGGILP